MKKLTVIFPLVMIFLAACTSAQPAPTVTLPPPTNTPVPPTATFTPTPEPTVTNTPRPTATHTPIPQILGRIFPEEFEGQAVWSNGDGDTKIDVGWVNFGNNYVIHFDVSLPTNGFSRGDPILAPANGIVEKIYTVRDEGDAIVIRFTQSIAGIEKLFSNTQELDHLSQGKVNFDYTLEDLEAVGYHFAHVVPYVSVGQELNTGDIVAEVYFDTPFTPKLSYVLYLYFNDGSLYQFSPCLVSNSAEFCGICDPRTPYRCP